jgi:hypothetical protein
MADPVAVPSAQGGSPTLPSDLYKLLKSVQNRVAVLERTSSLNSASIGSGGIAIYDAGAFRWYNYNYNNQLPKEDNLDALVFEIGAFSPTDTDYDAAFRYYYPNKQDAGDNGPQVAIGSFPQIGDPTKDSHGILVRAPNGESIAAFSGDGILLRKSKDADISGHQNVLRCMDNDNDYLILWMDNEQHYFTVEADAVNQRAFVRGGNSGAGYGVLMRMHGTSGSDTRQVHFLDSDTPSQWVPIHAQSFNTHPSSEAFKEIVGLRETDALQTILDAPIKDWVMTSGEAADRTSGGEPDVQMASTASPETHFSPSVEDLPEALVAHSDDPEESPGINLNAAIWTLWQATQQQQEQIDSKDKRIAALETKVEALTKSVEALLAK